MRQTVRPVQTKTFDRLQVQVYENRKQMGEAAGYGVAEKMKELLSHKKRIRMVFAAAPSQNEFLHTLTRAEGIDWSRVTAFHMDEYIGLPEDSPQTFGKFLRDRLFDLVQPGKVHLIDSNRSIEVECKRYGDLIKKEPIDIICLGIGENGHLAFNDPPVADFSDPKIMKPVKLDETCRQQQVNDGCFPNLKAVPAYALTLTIPVLMSATYLYCIVPGETKRNALQKALGGPITPECPASILRRHANCILYADQDSYRSVMSK
ncbi:glucosamine-6-phosphate deaminase [Paenactinomyces guangxiensis]|uniref:Glucosamine-6-phosphate deaminase n=1 Tax=Paenactinomyces guangxiensis TaxID=1490290 RepID=A0A7W1WUT8_9BACL|nr:glucosamine-6-phosphate deaminase [Paenactinomyces guangxiensis]MBA4496256.1 glucosamine-6-phosphate deaminase [Paenactinomyces guangxiensis]MBH8593362.1 glucosamine-6-phosphate deaminase [Paenactinomyces guangxiensis]